MPIYKGDRANPTAIYSGDSSLGKVYLGDNLVWQKVKPEFIFTISLTGSTEIILPLLDGYTYNFIVDWGDGNSGTVTAYNDADAIHTYSGAGNYDVSIIGICQCFQTYTYTYDMPDLPIGNIAEYITEIKQWGNCDFRSLSFAAAWRLTTLPIGQITGASNVINVKCLFFLTYITSIPEGLLDNCKKINSVAGSFNFLTEITSIPEGLFDNCPLITSCYYTFSTCNKVSSIPVGLFDNCPLITDFSYCFSECDNLSGNSPELWISHPSADGSFCFYGCTGLSNYADIPAGWK